jgi:hypothetical protein
MENPNGSTTDMIDLGFIVNALKQPNLGLSEEVEIAKGKYHIISSIAQARVQIKRIWQRKRLSS